MYRIISIGEIIVVRIKLDTYCENRAKWQFLVFLNKFKYFQYFLLNCDKTKIKSPFSSCNVLKYMFLLLLWICLLPFSRNYCE